MFNYPATRVDFEQIERDARKLRAEYLAQLFGRRTRR